LEPGEIAPPRFGAKQSEPTTGGEGSRRSRRWPSASQNRPGRVLLHAPDPAFVKEASKRGVLAYISDAHANDWQSSIDIVLRRFAEYHDLEGAFGRRALTERAKGILMERHFVEEASAFEMLRERSRTANRKLVDVATAVVDGQRLLPKHPQAPS
jgi:response regulator NasT